jgi:hypothetical protein
VAKHNVPIQSLIDHIKTAVDVDPWAKEMAEELLKEQEHKDRMFHALEEDWKMVVKEQEAVKPIFRENPYTHLPVSYCPKCREPINQFIVGNQYREVKYCHYCGQKVEWAES